MIEAVAEVGQTIYEAYRPDEIISYIKENPEYENVTIALSVIQDFTAVRRRFWN